MNETIQAIYRRRSCRSYTPEPLSDELLQTILEGARRAPSGQNAQSRHFTVVRSPEMLDSLHREAKALMRSSEDPYFRKLGENDKFHVLHGAKTLVIVSDNQQHFLAPADCSAACENMLIAAESLGLGSCWINIVLFVFEGPNGERFRQQLGIPQGYKPYGSVVLGHREKAGNGERTVKGNTVNYV